MFRIVVGPDGLNQVETIVPGSTPAPLSTELGRVRSAGVEMDRALAQLTTDRAGLFRADGEPKYSPKEMAEKEEIMAAGVRRALANVETVVAESMGHAERVAAATSAPDPVQFLTPDELTIANSRRAFVAEDVADLSFDQLEKRVAGVLATPDRVNQWLYHRYGDQRLAQMRRAAIDGDQALPTEFGRVRALVDRLGENLRPADFAQRAASAELLKQAAIDLRIQAGRVGRAASGVDTVGDAQRHMIKSLL